MKRLLIDAKSGRNAMRAAYLLDGRLMEIFIDNGSLVGCVINGVVKDILQNKFAFIDIGDKRSAFMNTPQFAIKSGDYIPVQVRSDAVGEKGAKVSDVIKIKGNFAILYRKDSPAEVGVSSKIDDKAKRKQLSLLARKFLPDGYSCVLRTATKNASEEELSKEIDHLSALHKNIMSASATATAPKILYRDNFILNEMLAGMDEIIINDKDLVEELNVSHVTFWEKPDLFGEFDVERQIAKARHRNVWLPCGGFVTFDQTEACVVIDVNSGKFTGKKNLDDIALKVNLEAAHCIARQITLRNLSGMIIIDFLDMPHENYRNLLRVFKGELQKDRIPAKIESVTKMGLVELTRRKQREPLNIKQPCPHCSGTGRV
ncbi:MAG: ribonuclease E/G [Turicibacter sp.]|nr:ribonuclease E/G [Turicibacter sp.]